MNVQQKFYNLYYEWFSSIQRLFYDFKQNLRKFSDFGDFRKFESKFKCKKYMFLSCLAPKILWFWKFGKGFVTFKLSSRPKMLDRLVKVILGSKRRLKRGEICPTNKSYHFEHELQTHLNYLYHQWNCVMNLLKWAP